jgi:cell division protein FtsL
MRISALFTRRVRGVRLVNLWGAGLLLVLVIGLYLIKTFAGGERADIARTELQIADEQRRIRLLQAEVAFLEQPSRIEHLSEQYLGLQPETGKQDVQEGNLERIARAGGGTAAR